MSEEVISSRQLIFARGMKMHFDGKPAPPTPSDDCTGEEPELVLWLGYAAARSIEFLERRAVAKSLNLPEPEWTE